MHTGDVIMPKKEISLIYSIGNRIIAERIQALLTKQGYAAIIGNDGAALALPNEGFDNTKNSIVVAIISEKEAEYFMKKQREGTTVTVSGSQNNVAVQSEGVFQIGGADSSIDKTALLNELEQAIELVKESKEISQEGKNQLEQFFADSRQAVVTNNENEKKIAKGAFPWIKKNILEKAPVLLAALANLTKIATFFGLTPLPK